MKTNKLFGGEYVAPAIEVVSTVVEAGFEGSLGVALTYGDEGAAGVIEDGNSYDL
ncbi:MAG: hypothetical protein J6Q21_03585 [Alistipes sp.]|nr:hypothetical protein [Alistipes sp.]